MSGIPGGDDSPAIELDPSTPVGMVRLLIADLSTPPLLTDQQLSAFLAAEGGNVKLGAALALTTISISEALISRKISTQDLSVDGPAVAAELRAQAKALRDQVAAGDIGDGSAGLEIAPVWMFPQPDPRWDCPNYF